jgi:hypothetical protein
VNSRTRPSFWRAYARLSEPNRMAARRAYALFAQNPDHPSLRFKKLGGYDHVWSVQRAGLDFAQEVLFIQEIPEVASAMFFCS